MKAEESENVRNTEAKNAKAPYTTRAIRNLKVTLVRPRSRTTESTKMTDETAGMSPRSKKKILNGMKGMFDKLSDALSNKLTN